MGDGQPSAINDISVTVNPLDSIKTPTVADVSINKLTADGKIEAKTGNWANGETPVFIITVEPDTNHKFKSGISAADITIGNSGIMQLGYTVTDVKVATDGKLIITVTKDAPIM